MNYVSVCGAVSVESPRVDLWSDRLEVFKSNDYSTRSMNTVYFPNRREVAEWEKRGFGCWRERPQRHLTTTSDSGLCFFQTGKLEIKRLHRENWIIEAFSVVRSPETPENWETGLTLNCLLKPQFTKQRFSVRFVIFLMNITIKREYYRRCANIQKP